MEDLITPKSEKEAIEMLNRYNEDLLPRKFGIAGKLWVTVLCIVIAIGLYNYIQQLRFGLKVTGLNDTVSWGIYISNFVDYYLIC